MKEASNTKWHAIAVKLLDADQASVNCSDVCIYSQLDSKTEN